MTCLVEVDFSAQLLLLPLLLLLSLLLLLHCRVTA
jgi:hypothetical protein